MRLNALLALLGMVQHARQLGGSAARAAPDQTEMEAERFAADPNEALNPPVGNG